MVVVVVVVVVVVTIIIIILLLFTNQKLASVGVLADLGRGLGRVGRRKWWREPIPMDLFLWALFL